MHTPTTKHSFLWLYIFLGALVIAIISHRANGTPIAFNVDPSWTFALNYAFVHKLIFGRDIHFTYGPLGFLTFSNPLGHNLLLASLFWFVARLMLALLLIPLIISANRHTHPSYYVLLIITGLWFFFTLTVYLLLFLTVTLILQFNQHRKHVYLIAAAAVVTVMFLIKPGLASYGLLALYSYLILFSFTQRDYKIALLVIGCNAAWYVLLWLLLYQSLAGALGFIISNIQFTAGFAQAMTLLQPNQPIYLIMTGTALAMAVLAFIQRPLLAENGLVLYVLLALSLVLCFKYSYTREDQHIYSLLVVINGVFAYWLLLIGTPRRYALLLVLGVFAMCCQYANQVHVGFRMFPIATEPNNKRFYRELLTPNTYKAQLWQESLQRFAVVNLPQIQGMDLSKHSVDIYPYNLSIIAAQELTWQPRPVIQSYTSYTGYLDNMNADFINRGRSADIMIWHGAPSLIEIDDRYLLNSEPNTVFALFNHYKPIRYSPGYVIMQRQDAAQLSVPQIFAQQQATWNVWIPIPDNHYDIVRAQLFFTTTWWYKLTTQLWRKNTPVYIDYRTNNDQIYSYSVVRATAEHGIWIKPFIQALSDQPRRIDPAAYPLLPTTYLDYQLDPIHMRNGFIELSGWIFAKPMNMSKLAVTLLLVTDKQAFCFDTVAEFRRDALARFPMFPNPVYSGFRAKLNIADLPTGHYQLYALLNYRGNNTRFGPITNLTIHANDKIRSNRITAIRLRTGDGFTPSFAIRWLGTQFLDTDNWMRRF